MIRVYKKKKIETKYIVIAVIVLIIALLVIFTKTTDENRKLSPVEMFIKDTVITTENIVLAPFRFVIDKVNAYKEMKDVYEENKKLKETLGKYTVLEAERDALKQEITDLKDLMKIDKTLTEYEYLNATTINRNVGYWYNSITIDKGKKNGVENSMAVITSGGLVGQIEKTSNFNSTVKLITTTDINNKISVAINSGGTMVYGILKGYDDKEKVLLVEGVSSDIEIKEGDVVTTTGLTGVFPSGILVGKVASIETDQFDLAKIVKVKSDVDFDHINFVTVLKRKDGTQ